ncbi:EscU/YscU/HrcU family type III secretion system export apparatus switch protein [Leptospira sp. 'Mane']|uniref:EscU/YscU/HrcU family type III secretion system export apparatus switch protein n=1 Tax=Leptospira sp. 'Mane' TaxID=3387407 RepID=UPI00398BA87B
MKKKAVALQFDTSIHQAPFILASADGRKAEKICEIAQENDIHLIEDQMLADSLSKLPVGTEIPRELYDSVSVIFRYLLSLQNEKNN